MDYQDDDYELTTKEFDEVRAKANEKLTAYAKQVFGADLVADAFFKVSDWNDHLLAKFLVSGCLDETRLFVRFCNGNVVELWNSEWGGFNSAEEEF